MNHQDLAARMRQQWNERALRDPMHHVLNRKAMGEWSKTAFLATGEENAKRFLDPFCLMHGIETSTSTLLEIGCGAGRESGSLAKRFRHVIALDVSDEMLAVARENVTAPNVEFVRGDGVSFEGVADESVHFVYSMIVFQHIPDPDVQYHYLAETARVLKPGGWFLIHLYADEPGYAAKLAKWQKRADAQDPLGWAETARPELVDNRFLTSMQTAVNRERVLATLHAAGLTLYFDQNPDTAAWLIGGQKA